MVGKTLGHYEILEPLGSGGMGEVYRARDTTLDRDVAIKVLSEEFATDPDRLARLERESLEQRLAAGPLPVEEALDIGKQIAEALEAAHGKGIIHRDLKPANVLITPDGRTKVLDFGIAKTVETGPQTAETQATNLTVAGALIGTAAYMSPEQARGEQVDQRADVWAFGCVLFEMLTGGKAFATGGDRGLALRTFRLGEEVCRKLDRARLDSRMIGSDLQYLDNEVSSDILVVHLHGMGLDHRRRHRCLCRGVLRRFPRLVPRSPAIRSRLPIPIVPACERAALAGSATIKHCNKMLFIANYKNEMERTPDAHRGADAVRCFRSPVGGGPSRGGAAVAQPVDHFGSVGPAPERALRPGAPLRADAA